MGSYKRIVFDKVELYAACRGTSYKGKAEFIGEVVGGGTGKGRLR